MIVSLQKYGSVLHWFGVRDAKLLRRFLCIHQGNEILENEYKRLESGEKMVGMDTKRYNLDPPSAAKRNDYTAWRMALDNAHSQLEHQYNRLEHTQLFAC